MKKTFLYVLMAAAALFTSTMSSCSDDDDTKNNEAEEAMIDDINQCILNNFVVLDGDNNLLREGLYGGYKDAADTTSFLFQVADAEAAVKFYNALMPDSLVGKVKVDGQKRTLSYTQEGKQYTMIYAPATGENIATITLPNVEGYNKYARTVQLRDHVSDNATAEEFKEKYNVGENYLLYGSKLWASNQDESKAIVTDENSRIYYYCLSNTGKQALFVYIPESGDMFSRRDVWYESVDRWYPIGNFTTNQCYDKIKNGGLNEYLPTATEVKYIRKEFIKQIQAGNDDDIINTSWNEFKDYINRIFSHEIDKDYKVATCETKNSLFSRKQVKYIDFRSGEECWMDKNSTNELDVIYVRIISNGKMQNW